MKFSNNLSDAESERLAVLAEEMGEAIQAIGKILRHGYESINPDKQDGWTNRIRLAEELGHVRYAVASLTTNGDVSNKAINGAVQTKADEIRKYLHHQSGRREGEK